MDTLPFVEIDLVTALILFLVGFVGGMVSGFIGSGGAFVLTPAMMSLGVPGAVAVASNMAHKFPKSLVGAYKRYRFGQVDLKLGLIMGAFAEAGVLLGKHIMVDIREAFGDAGTDVYVSVVFIVVLAIVGGFVLRDGLREQKGHQDGETAGAELNPVAQWVRRLHIPGTMVHLKSIGAPVSFLVIAPLGFATGLLASAIAVGGFIGVPAMMYVLGVPALMASATELVVAFVMGLGGSFFYALDGFVDIRLAMIILAGSLFGIQIGAIGTTYVQGYVVKIVMATIMLLVLVSRFFYIPGYLQEMGYFQGLGESTRNILDGLGQVTITLALLFGAAMIVRALIRGMREHRAQLAASGPGPGAPQETPGRQGGASIGSRPKLERILLAVDGSEASLAAQREAVALAGRSGGTLHVAAVAATGVEHETFGQAALNLDLEQAESSLEQAATEAAGAGVACERHLVHSWGVSDELIRLAGTVGADLLVMGRRADRGLADRLMGHTSSQVIGKAHCPVLVVPPRGTAAGQRMVVATDGSAPAAAAVAMAAQLGRLTGAPAQVVGVAAGEERAAAKRTVEQAVQYLTAEGVSAEGSVEEGDPAETITRMARSGDVGLVVVGSHGRGRLHRALVGSVAERVVSGSDIAVLVARHGPADPG